VLALLAERAETCSMCGHPMSVCRDPRTAGTWTVLRDTCYPSQVAQAVMEDGRRRGEVIMTRRTGG